MMIASHLWMRLASRCSLNFALFRTAPPSMSSPASFHAWHIPHHLIVIGRGARHQRLILLGRHTG